MRNLLDHVLGPNKSVVQVSVTMDWTTRNIIASVVDPNQTALRSSQAPTTAGLSLYQPAGYRPGQNLVEGVAKGGHTATRPRHQAFGQVLQYLAQGELERVLLAISDAGHVPWEIQRSMMEEAHQLARVGAGRVYGDIEYMRQLLARAGWPGSGREAGGAFCRNASSSSPWPVRCSACSSWCYAR